MTPLEFPATVDDTILATYGLCGEQANLQYLQHWKPRQVSSHLVAGSAYAAGLEALRLSFFIRGEPIDTARGHAAAAVIKEYGNHECTEPKKTLERILGAIDYYCTKWNPATDHYTPKLFPGDVPGIEFNFAVEIPSLEGQDTLRHPETNDPLLFTGRSDAILSNPEGDLYLLDDKTTTRLGATWHKTWRLRSQFTGYYWAARQLGIPIQAILIRGMCFYAAVNKESGTVYVGRETITQRTGHDTEAWLRTTQLRISRLINDYRSGLFELNLGDACNAYGGCPFRHICIAKDPEPWLRQDFRRARWNPLRRRLEPLEEGGRGSYEDSCSSQ